MKLLFFQIPSNMYKNFENWKNGNAQGYQFWGATHFDRYGIEISVFKKCEWLEGLIRKFFDRPYKIEEIVYSIQLLFSKKYEFDVLYCPYNGVNLFIFLKAIGLYKKKIVLWQHRGMNYANKGLKRRILTFMLRGVDRLYYFSPKFYNQTVASGLIPNQKLKLFKYGPDLEFYDKLKMEFRSDEIEENFFVHNGFDSRDYDTLVNSFLKTNKKLKLYLASKDLMEKYKSFSSSNIEIEFLPHSPSSSYKAAQFLNNALVATICHFPKNSATGIIGLLEAMALGKPVIATKNENIGINIEKEGFGILVDNFDVKGWINAINTLGDNPELARSMGKKARKMAEERYNLVSFSNQVAQDLKGLN